MSSESDFAYSLKYSTHFIIRNITGTPASQLHLQGDNPNIPPPYRSTYFELSPKKVIFVFNYPINPGDIRDLLQIPGVQESDIRASLLKGVLRHKFLCGDIELVSSNVDLLQFSDKQRSWLLSYGFTEGVQIGWDELDGYVQNEIITGGSGISLDGYVSKQQHKTLRDLIHFIDQGPGDGFASGAYKEILPTGNPFPTSVIWYLDVGKTKKLVEKFITYNANKFPTVIQWNMYDTDGVTLIHTVNDAITYDTAFESNRVRTIS
jgi:hypothetical protein